MGFRVIKTAIAVIIAMYLAYVLGVHTPAAAGLLAILGIEVTKRKGILSALHRIAASILALLISSVLFMLLGFHIWVAGLFVLIVFPILVRLRITEGAVTGAVVMFHLYAYESATFASVWNELLLLLIGLGSATAINIAYMPKADAQLLAHKQKIEQLFSDIFVNIAQHLRDSTIVWDGKEILEVSEEIERGASLAKRSMENTLLFGGDPYWRVYFFMRGEQLESIHRMLDLVAGVYQTLPQGEWVAAIFEDISQSVKEDYYTGEAEKELEELNTRYKRMPLPESREEFEVRSAIRQLKRELMHYLAIAKKQKKHRPEAG
ncbi:aromatic acid exporter family protein [Paenibacillus roseipurpureus]|uniref:Aromatic acid exporter family protein n=1 Tax=Paenibacillus roseopurpureus TaxID=2918901 RepID=A0AA96RGL1_9BACL|nr:aromatic acid exporter family protein [Paenibacillus sp. MBLB1832]WNR42303.1 aromatic acid exporter family protein [Paenibacillus sp. MBLB1832]